MFIFIKTQWTTSILYDKWLCEIPLTISIFARIDTVFYFHELLYLIYDLYITKHNINGNIQSIFSHSKIKTTNNELNFKNL